MGPSVRERGDRHSRSPHRHNASRFPPSVLACSTTPAVVLELRTDIVYTDCLESVYLPRLTWVVSEQPTRKVAKDFRQAKWKPVRTVGSHTVYGCPCGRHSFSLPDGHKTISPGVVRRAYKALAQCEGTN